MKTNTIMNGSALEHLKELPEKSINMVMTSPPYWALRDYGVKGQLGLEPTFDQYISDLCDIFDEVKRVLRDDGTIWVNIGDTYYGSGKGAGGDITDSKQVWGFENKEKKICDYCEKEFEGYAFQKFCGSACSGVDNTPREFKDAIEWKRKSREEYTKAGISKNCLFCEKEIKGKPNTQFCSRKCLNKLGNEFRSQKRMLPDKCLTMIPMRFAIEMVNRGWILRNVIIWHKPNAMPSSVKDRFTVDFEYLFFFSKKKKYYFETQYVPVQQSSIERMGRKWGGSKHDRLGVHDNLQQEIRGEERMDKDRWLSPQGRNKRVVWNLDPQTRGGKENFDSNSSLIDYDYSLHSGQQPLSTNSLPLASNLQDWQTQVDSSCSINQDKYPDLYKPFEEQKGNLWSINPKPFSEAHFAVYPEELCQTPIKAGCPELVCVKCGNPKELQQEKIGEKEVPPIGGIKQTEGNFNDTYSGNTKQNIYGKGKYEPTCNCNAGFTSGIILDPFFGAGTTGLVALKQGKKFIGIELNKSYIDIAKKRLKPYLEQRKLL